MSPSNDPPKDPKDTLHLLQRVERQGEGVVGRFRREWG